MALGIGLAGSGLLIFYYLGAMSVLKNQGELVLLLGCACCSAAQELQSAALLVVSPVGAVLCAA